MEVLYFMGGGFLLILFLIWFKSRKGRLRRIYLLNKYGKIRENAMGTSLPKQR